MITTDAFSVSEEVLGLPLAGGGRRLIAFAIDGILVGLLALLGWRILGVLMGVFFFRVATKRTPKKKPDGTMTSRAAAGIGQGFRYSVGCLGGIILFTTFIVGTGMLGDLLDDDGPVSQFSSVASAIGSGLEAASGLEALAASSNEQEADSIALAAAAALLEAGTPVDEAVDAVMERLPNDVVDDEDDFEDDLEERLRELAGVEAEAQVTTATDTVSLSSALSTFEANLGEPAGDPVEATDSAEAARLAAEAEQLEAARVRIAQAVAGDSFASLAGRIDVLRDSVRGQRQAAAAARQAAEESRGIFTWFVETLDELGLTFGWGALYFATLLTWFSGRTPGKRLMGIRVIRLDGEPITLFIAFERAGGYAAGVATGLLGFAQILWDANRQAIHDKIAGTAVILDGRPRIASEPPAGPRSAAVS